MIEFIWCGDCQAGQERFRTVTKSFYRSANGIIFVYDITNEQSFRNVRKWIDDVIDVDENVAMVLLGNKCDLDEKRVISREEGWFFLVYLVLGEQLAFDYLMEHIETSAKATQNIDQVFEMLVKDLLGC